MWVSRSSSGGGIWAVVQFTPRGRDHWRIVGLPVPPIMEEVEAVVQVTRHVRDKGHCFEQSMNFTVSPIIGEIVPVVLFAPHERDQERMFEQSVIFRTLGWHNTARRPGRKTSTGHKNTG